MRIFITHLKHNQIDTLPIDQTVSDPNTNHVPKSIINAIFSKVNPTPINNPKLVSISEDTFKETFNISFPSNINLKHQIYAKLTQIISGDMSIINQYIPNIIPYAHCYCGHQYVIYIYSIPILSQLFFYSKILLKIRVLCWSTRRWKSHSTWRISHK